MGIQIKRIKSSSISFSAQTSPEIQFDIFAFRVFIAVHEIWASKSSQNVSVKSVTLF